MQRGSGAWVLEQYARRSNLAASAKRHLSDGKVSPYFGLVSSPIRLEMANHLPAAAAKLDAVADFQANKLGHGLDAGNELPASGLKIPAGDDLQLGTNLKGVLGDATNDEVGRASCILLWYIGYHVQLATRDRDAFHLREDIVFAGGHAAGEFAVRPIAQHDRPLREAGAFQGGSET